MNIKWFSTFLHVSVAVSGETSVQIPNIGLVNVHFWTTSVVTNLGTDFDVFGITVKSFSETLTCILHTVLISYTFDLGDFKGKFIKWSNFSFENIKNRLSCGLGRIVETRTENRFEAFDAIWDQIEGTPVSGHHSSSFCLNISNLDDENLNI